MTILSRLHKLPPDLHYKIQRIYYSCYVVPCLRRHNFWQGHLQSALSKANMYTTGVLDVTGVTVEDRRCVYAELMKYNKHGGATQRRSV